MPRVYRYPPREPMPEPKTPQSEAPVWVFVVALILIAAGFTVVTRYEAIADCVNGCYPARAYYEAGYCYCAAEWRAP